MTLTAIARIFMALFVPLFAPCFSEEISMKKIYSSPLLCRWFLLNQNGGRVWLEFDFSKVATAEWNTVTCRPGYLWKVDYLYNYLAAKMFPNGFSMSRKTWMTWSTSPLRNVSRHYHRPRQTSTREMQGKVSRLFKRNVVLGSKACPAISATDAAPSLRGLRLSCFHREY